MAHCSASRSARRIFITSRRAHATPTARPSGPSLILSSMSGIFSRLESDSFRTAWERAGAARGLWLCCVGGSSLGGKKGSHPFLGIALPPRLARDPSAQPPFRKFISAFALRWIAFVALAAQVVKPAAAWSAACDDLDRHLRQWPAACFPMLVGSRSGPDAGLRAVRVAGGFRRGRGQVDLPAPRRARRSGSQAGLGGRTLKKVT